MCTALVILEKTCRNWMDFGLVSSSVVEEIAALMAAASFLEVSALRMLRMNLAAWEAHDIMQCWSWIVLSYNELYMMNWRNVDDVHRYIVFEQLIRNFIANRFRQGRLYVFLWDILPWTVGLMTSVLQFSGPTGVAVAVTTSGGFHVSMGVTPIAGWFTIENQWKSYFNGW